MLKSIQHDPAFHPAKRNEVRVKVITRPFIHGFTMTLVIDDLGWPILLQ